MKVKKTLCPVKTEDVLKAVILADSFTKEMRPITLTKPRCLLPINNIPIIEYILELLASSGVKEIYVYCCHGADEIKLYLENKWKPSATSALDIKISTIVGTDAKSTGDALRRIAEMDFIRNDFILIQGDVISNINLTPIVKAHKAERKLDSNILATSIFRKCTPDTIRFYEDCDSVWIAVSEKSKQLLEYENEKKENLDFKIETRHFKQTKDDNIRIYSNVMDCRIDICSPEILAVFQDQFDFTHLRNDLFQKYILHKSEVVEHKVIAHIIDNEGYCGRACNLHSYESISKDLVNRWMYPISPDSNFSGTTSFRYARPNNYYESNISLSKSCIIGENCLIGSGTTIGENTKIRSTVIGRNVQIGHNVEIESSFIWDNVVIEDNVKITSSLLCDNVKIGANSVLEIGSVLSYNVIIGSDFTVKSHHRLTTIEYDKDEYSNEEEEVSFDDAFENERRSINFVAKKVANNQNYVGVNGVGSLHVLPSFLSEQLVNRLGVSQSDADQLESEMALRDKVIISSKQHHHEDRDDHVNFFDEVRASIRRSIDENHSIENAKLELNGLKFTYDSSFEDIAIGCLTGIMIYCDTISKKSDWEMDFLMNFKGVLEGKDGKRCWSEVLEHFLKLGVKKSRVLLLKHLAYFVADDKDGKKFGLVLETILKILKFLVIVDKEIIIEWFEDLLDEKKETMKPTLNSCKEYVKELEEGSDEESESEEGSDEESESEEEEESD